ELLDPAPRGLAVARRQAEGRGDEPFLARGARLAVAVADLELARQAHVQHALAVDGLDAVDDVPGLAAVAAGVHRERAADRAGDAGEELAAGEAVPRGEARDLRRRHAGERLDAALH